MTLERLQAAIPAVRLHRVAATPEDFGKPLPLGENLKAVLSGFSSYRQDQGEEVYAQSFAKHLESLGFAEIALSIVPHEGGAVILYGQVASCHSVE